MAILDRYFSHMQSVDLRQEERLRSSRSFFSPHRKREMAVMF
ncbi:hypothetical protein COLO4_14447 [Corchorus olitorius]|uniref:Uncharacterized protein n=1 Tax=Corchorus olitorius TaxID=93759 RepID=A0A1R3JS98_9ROSI|nr:hypothetical protein COLO4_14447 [Corchorus olitorius]